MDKVDVLIIQWLINSLDILSHVIIIIFNIPLIYLLDLAQLLKHSGNPNTSIYPSIRRFRELAQRQST